MYERFSLPVTLEWDSYIGKLAWILTILSTELPHTWLFSGSSPSGPLKVPLLCQQCARWGRTGKVLLHRNRVLLEIMKFSYRQHEQGQDACIRLIERLTLEALKRVSSRMLYDSSINVNYCSQRAKNRHCLGLWGGEAARTLPVWPASDV